MIALSMYVMLYFEKYRATAIAFKYGGWAVSGIVGPPLLEYIARSLGPSGALLLGGALGMHALPIAMLVRHPRPATIPAWCSKKPPKTDACQATNSSTPVFSVAGSLSPPGSQLPIAVRNRESKETLMLYVREPRTEYAKHSLSNIALENKKEETRPTEEHLRSRSAGQVEKPHWHECTEATRRRNKDERNKNKEMNQAPRFLTYYQALFIKPAFYVFLLSFSTLNFSVSMHETTVVEYGLDKGAADLTGSNQLLTYTALGQLLGHVVVPFLADKMSISRCGLMAANFTVASLLLALISSVDNFLALVALTSVLGICEGYLLCNTCVLVADYLGVERLGPFFGLQGLCMIPTFLGAPSMLGETCSSFVADNRKKLNFYDVD
ncbi:hypothetical protein HPB48_013045 [Haemaphysalis longicornis]|uniref:Monocarboxylate transporter n=1 Tax=Haemaphysalis longicornis TaxID=44386 RepID=A0A9J6GGF6_HAELO|nr:hypothetical protein HPB48_013045 [Haemaphysalis longicornis]